MLVGLALVMLRRRSATATNAWSKDALTPPGGSTYGTLGAYFEKIAEFDDQSYDTFFVTASAVGSDHIVQMSSGTDKTGQRFYEFDVPLTGWSNGFAAIIEGEAHELGRTPVRLDSEDMGFLDVSFPDRDAHEKFARWVVTKVFDLPEETQYEITWG